MHRYMYYTLSITAIQGDSILKWGDFQILPVPNSFL